MSHTPWHNYRCWKMECVCLLALYKMPIRIFFQKLFLALCLPRTYRENTCKRIQTKFSYNCLQLYNIRHNLYCYICGLHTIYYKFQSSIFLSSPVSLFFDLKYRYIISKKCLPLIIILSN